MHFITDKAAWSSSADLHCQSCCVIIKVEKKVCVYVYIYNARIHWDDSSTNYFVFYSLSDG